jgi:hypothetical protein
MIFSHCRYVLNLHRKLVALRYDAMMIRQFCVFPCVEAFRSWLLPYVFHERRPHYLILEQA